MLHLRKLLFFVILMSVVCVLMRGTIAEADAPVKRLHEPVLRLYFAIPFAIETFAPITEKSLEEEGRSIWFMFPHKFVHDLKSLLEAHPILLKEEFYDGTLRVLAVIPDSGDRYLVNKRGVVLKKNTGELFELSRDDIIELEVRLNSLRGIVDVTVYDAYKQEREAK